MREILPGNPTEAGPESRPEPPMTYKDFMQNAEEECFFSRRRYDPEVPVEKALLLKAIFDAQEYLTSAAEAINGR